MVLKSIPLSKISFAWNKRMNVYNSCIFLINSANNRVSIIPGLRKYLAGGGGQTFDNINTIQHIRTWRYLSFLQIGPIHRDRRKSGNETYDRSPSFGLPPAHPPRLTTALISLLLFSSLCVAGTGRFPVSSFNFPFSLTHSLFLGLSDSYQCPVCPVIRPSVTVMICFLALLCIFNNSI